MRLLALQDMLGFCLLTVGHVTIFWLLGNLCELYLSTNGKEQIAIYRLGIDRLSAWMTIGSDIQDFSQLFALVVFFVQLHTK